MTALLERPDRNDSGSRGAERSRGAELRGLLAVAVGPAGASAAIAAALVLLTLVTAGAQLGGVAASTAMTWLAMHQVPVTLGGSVLGVLPLLPTALLVWATARSTAAALRHDHDPRRALGAAVAGPVVLAGLALALVHTQSADLPLENPNPVVALLAVAGVHLLGALLGAAAQPRLRERALAPLPDWLSAALLLVPRAVAELVLGAAVLTVLSLLLSLGTVADLVSSGGGLAGGLGLVVLSLGYLPNVVLGAVSVTVGPGAVLGQSTVTAFGSVDAPLPALPVLAAVPSGSGSWWWPVVLVVPVVVAARLGARVVRAAGGDTGGGRQRSVLAVLGATAVLAGLVVALLGALAGGTLGSGTLSPVGVPVLALGGATAAWLLLVSASVALLREHDEPERAERKAAKAEAVTVRKAAKKVKPHKAKPVKTAEEKAKLRASRPSRRAGKPSTAEAAKAARVERLSKAEEKGRRGSQD
ncbi:DUF6350 family protein [Rhodococcus sp. X156]|uniref:cell division protein PerM n=1 Tax=Rhodococcus sp. X156 TaxID=2499145 RepID=UPI000FD8DC82|nr:DUF6350 family protein [Rhodococcus sp. X156]